MAKLEIERKLTLSRQEAADRLMAIGRALGEGSDVELSSGGDKLKLSVGARIEWELEIEIDGNETELEIELKWRDDTSGEDAPVAHVAVDREAPATTRRGRTRKSSS
jgi:amphi-Trp domain-containing protein